MKQKTYLNPHYTQKWDIEDSNSFIKKSIKIYKNSHYASWGDTILYVRPNLTLIYKLYKEGRDLQVLSCTFEDFKNYLQKDLGHTYYYRVEKVNSTKYSKKRHSKKVLSDEEINDRLWKEKVNKYKKNPHWRNKCGTFYKNSANRKHRRWEKSLIKNENWDDLSNLKIKELQDPWIWD